MIPKWMLVFWQLFPFAPVLLQEVTMLDHRSQLELIQTAKSTTNQIKFLNTFLMNYKFEFIDH